jgi:putative flippase GtrA
MSKQTTEARRFVAFVTVGGVAALVNILSRVAISQAVSYELSIILAFWIGVTTAFLLSRFFVFEASGRSMLSEFVRFVLVNVVALVQVWCVSILLARVVFPSLGFAWHAEITAHVVGVLSPVIISYYAHKRFSFGRRESTKTGR